MKRTALCFFLGPLLLGCNLSRIITIGKGLNLPAVWRKIVLNIRREKRAFPNGYSLEYSTTFQREY